MKSFMPKDPFRVFIYTSFLSQLFFTLTFTMNLLYQVEMVKLNPLQLVLVGTVLELSVFLFEIPTGMVADVKSRKLSIIIGFFLIGIGFLIEGLFPYFTTVLLSQIIWGIGYTFTSGAQQAWIADEIGEERAGSAFIRGASMENMGKFIAIPLSIWTGYYMLNLPIIIGGLGMAGLAILLIFFMKEEKFIPLSRAERVSTWESMKENTKQIISYSKVSRILRYLFLIALFYGFYSEGFDRLWITHLLKEWRIPDLPKEDLVILVGAIQLIVAAASSIALYFMEKALIHQKLQSIYISLLTGSFLIISSLTGFALSTTIGSLIVFYVVIQVTRSLMYPLESVWLNGMIKKSSTRASFFSVKGQVDAIGQISGGPVIGMVASAFSIKIALFVSAVLLTPVLFFYRAVLKKEKE